MASLLNSKNLNCENESIEKREDQETIEDDGDDDESFMYAMQIAISIALPMALQCAIDLGVFEVLQKAGKGAQLSADDIVSRLSNINNPKAFKMLDRILALLASHSLLNCSIIPHEQNHINSFKRYYSMTPVAKFFAPNSDGVSLGPLIALNTDKILLASWLVTTPSAHIYIHTYIYTYIGVC
ncbi:putative caffeate O-methyltransferase [Medicago truncatula]|uniref:Putative caffeate O-methyltransferase n=1 Tax=Medicago truncatula TaxID=3880 RepID=A0A396HJ00_MEDTR|nr:putative caffeate O-methyltransferase [Medicago truncatula]